jgi:hypothetical protein
MGPTCCPEMLVNNYHMTPRNKSAEHITEAMVPSVKSVNDMGSLYNDGNTMTPDLFIQVLQTCFLLHTRDWFQEDPCFYAKWKTMSLSWSQIFFLSILQFFC